MTKGRKWRIAAVVVASIGAGLWIVWLAIRPPLIDVHERRVEARLRGSGTPTVVFELGASGGGFMYWRVQNAVAKHTRTVVYERAKIPGARRVLMVDSDHISILLKDQLAEEILKVVNESRSGG